MSDLQSALHLAQKHPDQFLSQIVFPELIVDDFKFGKGPSGHLGSNMISQPFVVPAQTQPGGLKPLNEAGHKLAVHLNCTVTASALQNNSITIVVGLFHITARTLANQVMIDKHGPSIITADNSIHTNVNTEWGRGDNLKKLAEEVGIEQPKELTDEMVKKQGYNEAFMKLLVKKFRERVTQRIQMFLGGQVTIKWDGDKTFILE